MAETSVKYPDVTVELSGRSGNAMSIIAAVRKGIARVHGQAAAAAYAQEAMSQPSYDDLLRYAMATVDVE